MKEGRARRDCDHTFRRWNENDRAVWFFHVQKSFVKKKVFNGIKIESDQQRQETRRRGTEIPSQLKTLRPAQWFAHLGIPCPDSETIFSPVTSVLVMQKTASCACLWRGFVIKFSKGFAKSGQLCLAYRTKLPN